MPLKDGHLTKAFQKEKNMTLQLLKNKQTETGIIVDLFRKN